MCVKCSSKPVSVFIPLCVTGVKLTLAVVSGVGVPHDLVVTGAMLYVVVIMRTSSVRCNLEKRVTAITTDWLCGAESPLGAFPQLSTCHALLAKLPPFSLLANSEGKSLLLDLFPIISRLFDRYKC